MKYKNITPALLFLFLLFQPRKSHAAAASSLTNSLVTGIIGAATLYLLNNHNQLLPLPENGSPLIKTTLLSRAKEKVDNFKQDIVETAAIAATKTYLRENTQNSSFFTLFVATYPWICLSLLAAGYYHRETLIPKFKKIGNNLVEYGPIGVLAGTPAAVERLESKIVALSGKTTQSNTNFDGHTEENAQQKKGKTSEKCDVAQTA